MTYSMPPLRRDLQGRTHMHSPDPQQDRTGRRPPIPDAARAWLAGQTLPALSVLLARGLAGRCPACGRAPLFRGFLRLVERCASCGAPLGEIHADDAPPYFTIFITAHVMIALVVVTGQETDLPVWVMIALFLPLTLAMAMLLLRPIKGATASVMLKLGLIGEHGAGGAT